MDQLTVHEKTGPNYKLLELSGVFDAYNLAEVSEKIYGYIKDKHVVLDMDKILAMDSAGTGVVLACINDGLANGNKVFIMNPSDAAHHALERTGFYDTFYIIHSVTEVSDAS